MKTVLLSLILWHQPIYRTTNIPRCPDDGFAELSVTRPHADRVRVWLNGRRLREGTDYWVVLGDTHGHGSGIVPSKGVERDWRDARSVVRVDIR